MKAKSSPLVLLLWARGLRDFGDGFVAVLLPLYLTRSGRPYDAGITHLLIARSADPSFPSDHATATFAIAAVFLLHGLRVRGGIFLAAAVIVSFSRVYKVRFEAL